MKHSRATAMVHVALRDGADCFYCGRQLGSDITLDHVDPAKRGWETDNLRICCRRCNSRKSSRTYQEWLDAEHEQALWLHTVRAKADEVGRDALYAAIELLVGHPGLYEELVRHYRYHRGKWRFKA